VEELRQYAWAVAMRVLAQREDAEDVAQETMVRALRALRNGTPIAAQRAYAGRVALHLAIDRLRRERRRPTDIAQAAQQRAKETAPPPPEVERLYAAIAALPPRQAAVITLRKLMELEYADIGGLLGISVENCRSHCRLALRRLRAALGEGAGAGTARGES
jgi:RNA polymerase sigma-70 factor (ECF subfamily)